MANLVDALKELRNALQVARPLARSMRREATEQARLAYQIELAVERASDVLARIVASDDSRRGDVETPLREEGALRSDD